MISKNLQIVISDEKTKEISLNLGEQVTYLLVEGLPKDMDYGYITSSPQSHDDWGSLS